MSAWPVHSLRGHCDLQPTPNGDQTANLPTDTHTHTHTHGQVVKIKEIKHILKERFFPPLKPVGNLSTRWEVRA